MMLPRSTGWLRTLVGLSPSVLRQATPFNDSPSMIDADERFARLVDALGNEPGVTGPGESGGRGFGSLALKVNGSIFAMLTRGQLVVKLPRERVKALIQDGTASAFDAGKGIPMKEWLTVVSDDSETWMSLAREALDFVSHRSA
jgi:hypothetical protein